MAEICLRCRLAGRAGFLDRYRQCLSCNYIDDGNRVQQSPYHVPNPVPVKVDGQTHPLHQSAMPSDMRRQS